MTNIFRNRIRIPSIELPFWIAGLIYLALINPEKDGHLTFCGFRLLGVKRCPGCRLGKSVAFLFKGKIGSSIRTHPLGLFAVIVILARIRTLATPVMKCNAGLNRC